MTDAIKRCLIVCGTSSYVSSLLFQRINSSPQMRPRFLLTEMPGPKAKWLSAEHVHFCALHVVYYMWNLDSSSERDLLPASRLRRVISCEARLRSGSFQWAMRALLDLSTPIFATWLKDVWTPYGSDPRAICLLIVISFEPPLMMVWYLKRWMW